jgi:hypothetical protein
MALMDEAVWRGKIYSGGWVDTGRVTIRGNIAPHPF